MGKMSKKNKRKLGDIAVRTSQSVLLEQTMLTQSFQIMEKQQH